MSVPLTRVFGAYIDKRLPKDVRDAQMETPGVISEGALALPLHGFRIIIEFQQPDPQAATRQCHGYLQRHHSGRRLDSGSPKATSGERSLLG